MNHHFQALYYEAIDAQVAIEFYSSLFGWEVAMEVPATPELDVESLPFRVTGLDDERQPEPSLFLRDGRPLARILPAWEERGNKVLGWVPGVVSADLEGIRERFDTRSAPRQVHESHDPHFGRTLWIRDMEGAVTFACNPPEGSPVRGLRPEGPGSIWWVELQCVGDETQVDFYREVFAWRTELTSSCGDPYRYFADAEGGDPRGIAGSWLRRDWSHGSSYWLVYFEVASVEETVERALSLGGSLWVGPEDLGAHERFALLRDGEGRPFGVVAPR